MYCDKLENVDVLIDKKALSHTPFQQNNIAC